MNAPLKPSSEMTLDELMLEIKTAVILGWRPKKEILVMLVDLYRAEKSQQSK